LKCGLYALGACGCRAGARHAAGAGALSTHQRASQSRLQDGRQRATTYLQCARVRCGRACPTLLHSMPAGAGGTLVALDYTAKAAGPFSPPGMLSFSRADEPGSPSTAIRPTTGWWLPTSAAFTPFAKLPPTLWVLYAPSPLLPISIDSGRSRGVILLASSASTLPLSLCRPAENSVPCDGAISWWQGLRCAALYLAQSGSA